MCNSICTCPTCSQYPCKLILKQGKRYLTRNGQVAYVTRGDLVRTDAYKCYSTLFQKNDKTGAPSNNVYYTEDGFAKLSKDQSPNDIVKELLDPDWRYVNFYSNGNGCTYPSKEEADGNRGTGLVFVCMVRVDINNGDVEKVC